MKSGIRGFAFAAVLLLAGAGGAFAEEPLSGDEIEATVSGVTVEGAMSDGMAYSEYYDEDGTIKGEDYQGKWMVEGDMMCFAYEADGSDKACWQVGRNADGVVWMKDGKVEGMGKVTMGNPHNY
jgi:hypothetical protein